MSTLSTSSTNEVSLVPVVNGGLLEKIVHKTQELFGS